MMCQLCGKRPANVCINIDINGVKSQRFICDKCAEERKLRENPTGPAILALVRDIKNAGGEDLNQSADPIDEIDRKCSSCGTAYKDFVKTSMLGCEDCYESFKDLLEPILEQITKPSEEKLKEKQAQKKLRQSRNNILRLRLQLKQCIENEDYEKAAEIRDKIAALESGAPKEGNDEQL